MAKFYGFFSLLLLIIGLFAWLVYHSILTASSQHPIPADAIAGRTVFQKKACIECHTVFGNGGYVGGDLTKVYGKKREAAITQYLTDPPVLSGAKSMRHDRLSQTEAQAMADYLRFLNSIDTSGWPPNAVKNSSVGEK